MIFVVNQFSVETLEKTCSECGKIIQATKMLTEHMKRIHELKTPHLCQWENLVLGMNKYSCYQILGM